MNADLIGIGVHLFLIVIFGSLAFYFGKRLGSVREHAETRIRAREIVSGVVAGIVVIILDRLLIDYFQNLPAINWSSFPLFLQSFTAVLLSSASRAAVILGLIFWALWLGIGKKGKK